MSSSDIAKVRRDLTLFRCIACTINVISYEKAYCLFPRATLHEHRSLLINADSTDSAEETVTLQERGFEMFDYLTARELLSNHASSSIVFGWRWIDDSASWVINLDTKDVVLPVAKSSSFAEQYDPVAICNFSVRFNRTQCKATITFDIFSGPDVEYAYALGDSEVMERLILSIRDCCPVWDGKTYVQYSCTHKGRTDQ